MTLFKNLAFSLRQLQYAVAISDTGGFGSAAELCGVSQPSLSSQVAKLEEGLGVQLFERHARGVGPTAAGQDLLPQMRAVLDQSRQIGVTAQALTDPYAVTLRVGVIPTVAPYLLPHVVELNRARRAAPRIHWLELQTDACERALAAGDLDAVVIADPPTLPSVDHVDLGWEPFVLVVPEDNPLGASANLAEVARFDVLLLEDGHCLRDHAMSLCMLPGAQESPYRATSLPTLVQMVSAGFGVSVLPASAVPVETLRAHVRVVQLQASGVGRTQRMAWRARSPHTRVLREVAGLLREGLERALASQ